MSHSLDDLVEEIHEWQLATFPQANANAKYKHLRKEIDELGEDLSDKSEIADCFLLLIGIAKVQGYNLYDILAAKLKVNKTRSWGPPDEDGVVEHVE